MSQHNHRNLTTMSRRVRLWQTVGSQSPNVQWTGFIAEHVAFLVAAGRPATTVRLRRGQLCYAAAGLRPCQPGEVGTEHLIGWLAGQSWASETRRSYRAALRGFFGWAHE